VNANATGRALRLPDASAVLEAVMRQRTDLVADKRRVLAIAVGAALDETLQGLTHLDYRRAARATAVELRFVAESFDVIICDSERFGAEAPRAPRELTRMLRPGGRLILAVAAERSDAYRRQLAAEGFLVALAHAGADTHVLLGVRGEFAADRR
jgi:protein-L-isoaspartate O-methyltransferase